MADDASPNCRFYVEIDHKRAAVFTELSGLQVEMEVQEYMAVSYTHLTLPTILRV